MIAIKTTKSEIKKRGDMIWLMYTDLPNSMLAIENNHPTLNQIYDILVEFHHQGKQITLCKVPAHTRIKEKEEADKIANKQ